MANPTQTRKVSKERLNEVRSDVANCMDGILQLFRPGAKITVLVRTPGNDNADFMMTSDSIEDIAAMVERSKRNPES